MTGWRPYEEVHGRANTVSGTVLVWPKLESKQLGRTTEIAVYLPPSLAAARRERADQAPGGRRYPVIYFHDGQNMFDDHTSYVGEWRADEALETLAEDGLEAIAVAIPNGSDARGDEYSPWRVRTRWQPRRLVGGKGDAYLEWLVGEIKPLIDRSFPTRTDREGTGLCGSSLGALISLYGMTKYPDEFGMVGALSPSVRWSDYALLRLVEEGKFPLARVYIDVGGREYRGMTSDGRRLRDAFIARGWVSGRDLLYVEDRYGGHREDSWARRLPTALRFLLGNQGAVQISAQSAGGRVAAPSIGNEVKTVGASPGEN